MDINQIINSNLHPCDSSIYDALDPRSGMSFDSCNGVLILKGSVTIQDMYQFYCPLVNQLTEYLSEGKELMIGIFFADLCFCNVKMLFNLFSFIRAEVRDGATIKVKWFVDPDDANLAEFSRDFEELFAVGTETILTKSEYE